MRQSRSKNVRKRHKRPNSLTTFREMKGRTVERIEVFVSSDYRCVSIRFEDKTDFTVELDTRLVLTALHSGWKSGNMRVLKRWPPIEE
jgi:hypothetical protein